jgi:hypothetical protein
MQAPEVGQIRTYRTSNDKLRRVKITRLDTEVICGIPTPVFDGELLNPDDTPATKPMTVWGYYDQLFDEPEIKTQEVKC